MNRTFLTAGALLGAVAVIAGAFGAHSLKNILSAESLQVFETGVRYQFYHALALIAVGMLYKEYPAKLLQWSGRLFITGVILFSGSLYVLCALKSLSWLGIITPIGGLCFIAGWLCMAMGFGRKN